MFQIVRCILAENGEVAARQPLQPLFDLWEDATAIAEFDSSRLSGDYGYDEARDCWWASDSLERMYRFEVEQVAAARVVAGRERALADAGTRGAGHVNRVVATLRA